MAAMAHRSPKLRRLTGLAALALGLALAAGALAGEARSLQLWAFGRTTEATIIEVAPAGHDSLAKGRFGGSGPSVAEAYLVAYRFETASTPVRGATRLTFYEIYDRFPDDFSFQNLSGPVGRSIRIRYMANDPSVSAIAHAPPYAGFWGLIVPGSALLAAGVALLAGDRRRNASPPPPSGTPSGA